MRSSGTIRWVLAVILLLGGLRFAFGVDMEPVPPLAASDALVEGARVQAGEVRVALASRVPRQPYVVVDRANNRLWVRTGREVSLEATVSTGSGTILRETGGAQRIWTFDTPAGRHEVLRERQNPVWVKPDWAFLEEGDAPPSDYSQRVERGTLGEWALDLGDGYMIHGTLYERLLGRSLTHGCIRVGRDDLRAVAAAVGPGTSVIIF